MPVYIVPSALPLFTLKFENPNSKLATKSVTYFFGLFLLFFVLCTTLFSFRTAPVSTMVISG